jgi:hypothetical protein
MSPTNISGRGAEVRIWHVGLYIRRLTDEYIVPRGAPQLTRDPYSRQLTDEYKSFIFLLLSVLAAFPDGEPPKQAQYTGI